MASKASQKQKSTNAKCTHKATNFRQCSNPDIDLEHRKKMRHSNKLLSPEEIEKEQIQNPLVQTLLLGQWTFWNRSEIKEIKTLDGEEPYRNYLSLPLGLDKDATCVIDILHYLTLEETSKGESCCRSSVILPSLNGFYLEINIIIDLFSSMWYRLPFDTRLYWSSSLGRRTRVLCLQHISKTSS